MEIEKLGRKNGLRSEQKAIKKYASAENRTQISGCPGEDHQSTQSLQVRRFYLGKDVSSSWALEYK